VPGDTRVDKKEQEKDVDKYQDLARETKRLWKVKARLIPIVIGTLRSGGEPENIGNNNKNLNIQKVTLL